MWINRGVRGRDVCVHGANRICTRASLRFHGGGLRGERGRGGGRHGGGGGRGRERE